MLPLPYSRAVDSSSPMIEHAFRVSSDLSHRVAELQARFLDPLPAEFRHALAFAPHLAGLILSIWLLRRIRRHIQIAALSSTEEHDILDLWQHRFVLPRATGQGITHINAEVRNLTRKALSVVIHPGTYFISSGHFQNMATVSSHRFTLGPRATERIGIAAACINAGMPIPQEKDRFHGVAKAPESVALFLESARLESPMVLQAGVWALTDGLNSEQIQARLISQSSDVLRRPAISPTDVLRAKCILDSLGIQHRI